MKLRGLVITVLLLFAVTASADAKHDRAAAAQAKELYKKGMTHYQLGEFDTAIGEFKAAYELTSAPGLLFNLAQVQRMKKDWEQALHFYRMYLRLDPAAANRADVEALIAEVQKSYDDEQRARQAPRPETVPPTPLPVAPAAPPPPSLTMAPPPAPPPHWRAKLAVGAALTGLGVAAIGAGIGLGAKASDDAGVLSRDSMVGTNQWDGTRQALYNEGQTYNNAGIALDVVGAAMVVTGVVVGVLGLRDRARARRWSLGPAPGGTGVACAF